MGCAFFGKKWWGYNGCAHQISVCKIQGDCLNVKSQMPCYRDPLQFKGQASHVESSIAIVALLRRFFPTLEGFAAFSQLIAKCPFSLHWKLLLGCGQLMLVWPFLGLPFISVLCAICMGKVWCILEIALWVFNSAIEHYSLAISDSSALLCCSPWWFYCTYLIICDDEKIILWTLLVRRLL